MSLKKSADFLNKGLSPLNLVIRNIAGTVIIIMMLLTVADITGRRLFNSPIIGVYELSEFMLVIVVFFSLACCEFLKGHVTIELVVSRLGQRTQQVIDIIMYCFFLVTFCVLTWRLYLYGLDEVGGYLSKCLNVPVFPFIFLAAVGSALVSLVVLMNLLTLLAGALKK